MFLKAKVVAFLGMMAAVTVLFISLGAIMETSTLFFLSAASYLVGVAIREHGLKMGAVFYVTCVVLGFLVAPNKMHCFTYTAFGLYIWVTEWIYPKLIKIETVSMRKIVFWMFKFFVFNVIYIPSLLLYPTLFVGVSVTPIVIFGLLAAGQVALVIYDFAYIWFQCNVWNYVRTKFR